MQQFFTSTDEVLTDESFLSWFYHNTPEKDRQWNAWRQAHPEQKPLIEEAITILSELKMQEHEPAVSTIESAWQKLDASLGSPVKEEAPVIEMQRSNRWWKIAAAAVVVLFAGLSIWKFTGNSKMMLTSHYGEVTSHQLPDGSEIILNANSTVTLGKNWDKATDREVWLNGEAFFRVKKTAQHNRFIVHAKEMDIIVTGTQFNVITRSDRNSVLLTEGSVTIRSKNGKEIVMKPGDFVELNRNDLEKRSAQQEAILAWKENKLLFDNTPMPEAARIISEHYGIKITLDSQSQLETLNGILQNNNLEGLLQSLENAKGFKITRKENELLISKP
jgi:transmembrane sensor